MEPIDPSMTQPCYASAFRRTAATPTVASSQQPLVLKPTT
jgi:hypothetical protein